MDETVNFDASASTPNGGNIVNYIWDFGDGTPEITENDPFMTHVYASNGTYTVTLNVTNSEGRWDTESKQINIKSSGVIKVPQEYSTIQEAINQADQGSKILVSRGIYEEHLIVNKTVSIIGENKSTTIIDAGGIGTVVRVTADYVNISGFTIQNSCPVCYGLYISFSSHCLFLENIVTNNGRGIYAFDCRYITIKDNLVTNNHFGISLVRSTNNILRNNSLQANRYNLDVSGISFQQYIQDVDTSNTADGKPVYYWINERNRQVPPDAAYVAVVNSTNIVVKSLNLSKNYQGLLFAYTNSSTIQNVTLSNNMEGILFFNSHNNYIANNLITCNRDFGIALSFYSSNNTVSNNLILKNKSTAYDETTDGVKLEHHTTANKIIDNTISDNFNGIRALSSSANIIYHNNFINNTVQEYGLFSTNIWDNGTEGNYWTEYTGEDLDGDGIGDTPYIIDANNKDRYPLMNPYIPSD